MLKTRLMTPKYAPALAISGQPYTTLQCIPDAHVHHQLRDTLDTKTLEQGKHFTAELREELLTPSGLLNPQRPDHQRPCCHL